MSGRHSTCADSKASLIISPVNTSHQCMLVRRGLVVFTIGVTMKMFRSKNLQTVVIGLILVGFLAVGWVMF